MPLRLNPCPRARVFLWHTQRLYCRWAHTSTTTTKHHEPLRVLFCGADAFSIYSLRALHALKERRPDKIASIDVVCRPDKRVGRGLKKIQEVPIKPIATALSLPIHQIDTFTCWTPPNAPNLIVTVSFGLLVPARVLRAATHGGLNVHPSLLPDLRGPAPLQHALLRRRTHTGVSLQTMHPTKFDHGVVLAQTAAPGVHIPDGATPQILLEMLGPVGAEMLVRGIEEGVFVTPLRDVREGLPEPEDAAHAPKVSPRDREIDWAEWSADTILLRDRVLGRLWTGARSVEGAGVGDGQIPRAVFTGPWRIEALPAHAIGSEAGALFMCEGADSGGERVGFATRDGKAVSPAGITLDGGKKDHGVKFLIDLLRHRVL